jgi:DNA adenine methylase
MGKHIVPPVIKWAGGKRLLAPILASKLDYNGKHRYFEPFLGGAALMLYMKPNKAVGIDRNPELINFYQIVRDQPEDLIKLLETFFVPADSDTFFYEIRAWDRKSDYKLCHSALERAARFIYLNKTCFNGLWRVNSKGENNVPYGYYKKPRICNPEGIKKLSKYLKHHAEFIEGDYLDVLPLAKKGDFVYFDPPYDIDPVGKQSEFVEYTKNGFSKDDQKQLKSLCDKLLEKGVFVAESNSNTPFINDLYEKDQIYSLYKIDSNIVGKRYIGGIKDRRREVNELLIIGKPKEEKRR